MLSELNVCSEELNTFSVQQKVVFVVGPTASGKSQWALEKAIQTGGSIVNIDSIQVYQGLEIGAASPNAAEQSQAPHYLYSYVVAPEEMTAGRYIQDFYKLLKKSIRFPLFVVGGTGFYIQALEKGMYDVSPVPPEVRLQIENELTLHGAERLHQELLRKDPQSFIHVNDHYRLVRALEIIRYHGKTPSEMKLHAEKNKNPLPFRLIKFGFSFSKEEFAQRVRQRTQQMIKKGIIEETEFFLKQNCQSWAPLASVGFKETVEYLQTNKNLDWLQLAIEQSTMQLIKKQKTWFKRDKSVLWSELNRTESASIDQKLDQFLHED